MPAVRKISRLIHIRFLWVNQRTLRVNTTLGWVNPVNPKAKGSFRQAFAKPRFWMYHYGTARLMDG